MTHVSHESVYENVSVTERSHTVQHVHNGQHVQQGQQAVVRPLVTTTSNSSGVAPTYINTQSPSTPRKSYRRTHPVPPLELPPKTPPRTPPRSANSSSVFIFPTTVPTRSPQEEEQVYTILKSFPEDRTLLSVSDVEKALNALNFEKFVPSFRQNFIDGNMLTSMNSGMLQEEFGFSKFEAMKLMKFAHGWSPQS